MGVDKTRPARLPFRPITMNNVFNSLELLLLAGETLREFCAC